MKKIFLALSIVLSLSAFADIEHSSTGSGKATSQEISKNRACFEELKLQGCGDPGDDIKHFRSCLNNVYDSLTDHCQGMMSNLYGVK